MVVVIRRGSAIAIVFALLLVGSLFAPLAIADELDHGDERGDLDIRQPTYVDSSVDREETTNSTVYHVEGATQEIRLESVNHDDVEAFGVLEGSGSITYEETGDVYVFDAEEEAGTRVLYWDVVETVEEEIETSDPDTNGTTTETRESEETVRYVATLSVDSVEWVHRTADQDEELRNDAGNWSSVESTATRVNPDQPPEETIEEAFRDHEFLNDPFASFTQDARGTVMMATRPGGLAVFGLVLGLASVVVGISLVKLHRKERQLEEIGDVDEAREEAYLEMAEEILAERDWSDFLPEHLARHCRNYLGRNCYLGFKRYILLRSPSHTKGLLLQLMGQVGYVGRARLEDDEIVEASVEYRSDRDDVATDGGEEALAVDLERLDVDSERDRSFVELVSGDELDVDVLYQAEDLDLDAVEWPIDEREASDSEILEALNPDFPDDFEDEEQLADALSGLMNLVANHDFTTEEGRPRRDRDMLSFLGELDAVLADEVDFPLAHVQRRMLILAAQRMDKGEEVRQQVDRLSEEGLELGGEIDDRDDDPDGGTALASHLDAEEDDVDDGIETTTDLPDLFDEDSDDQDVDEDAPVDGRRRETTGDDGSPLPDDADAPLLELATAAGYSVTDEGLEELREDAGVTMDMDDEEIASRVLVHCRKEIPTEELIEILDADGDGGGST